MMAPAFHVAQETAVWPPPPPLRELLLDADPDELPSHQGVGSHDAAAGVIGGITGVDIAGQRADSRHGSGNRSRSNNLDGSARKSSAGKGCHSCRNTDDVLGLHDYYLVRVLIVDLLTRKEKYLFPLVKESETFPSQM